ncbi:MAG: ABC transporter ATP-binding protein [Pseudomonadota bacterium]
MLLEVKDVHKAFSDGGLPFLSKKQEVLRGVNLTLREGECLGVVGESGSGKTTLGKVILGLERPDAGEITFCDALAKLHVHERRSMVFQDYRSSVNPRQTVTEIIEEPLLCCGERCGECDELICGLLEEVGLDAEHKDRLPHQLSGGQLQRVCMARAIAPNPRFILFDEAVSSLDVSIQVQILDLLRDLKSARGLSYIFITHDIAVAAYLCDRLVFFNEGVIVEELEDLSKLANVEHPYTRELLDAARYLEMKF